MLYDNSSLTAQTTEITNSIEVSRCIRQGHQISPKLFNNLLEEVFKTEDIVFVSNDMSELEKVKLD